jgi:hypothetical protein
MGIEPAHVVAVVCANGLGHHRRTVAILARLLERRRAAGGELRITLVAEPWQRNLTRGWWATEVLDAAGATWIGGVVDPGVCWSTSARTYDDGRLLGWVERLRGVEELAGADLVLSDNLPQVLALRSDAVLVGSFLWSDVLAAAHGGSAPVEQFVEVERALLDQHRPPMLCVGVAAMPGVLERTDAVALPWMCDPGVVPGIPGNNGGAVAVLGGRTGAADDLLAAAATLLVADGRRVLVQDGLDVDGTELFAFASSWPATDAVLCRPGMGTLTDAVAARTPVIAVHEARNAELDHNAAVVARLELGEAVPPRATAADAAAVVAHVLEPRVLSRYRAALAAQRCDGLDRAAAWLEARLAIAGAT